MSSEDACGGYIVPDEIVPEIIASMQAQAARDRHARLLLIRARLRAYWLSLGLLWLYDKYVGGGAYSRRDAWWLERLELK